MRISDCSSDVCSSDLDLALGEIDAQAAMNAESERHVRRIAVEPDLVGMLILLGNATGERNGQEHAITGLQLYARQLNVDRKSVVEGKRVFVRVHLGGRRIT